VGGVKKCNLPPLLLLLLLPLEREGAGGKGGRTWPGGVVRHASFGDKLLGNGDQSNDRFLLLLTPARGGQGQRGKWRRKERLRRERRRLPGGGEGRGKGRGRGTRERVWRSRRRRGRKRRIGCCWWEW